MKILDHEDVSYENISSIIKESTEWGVTSASSSCESETVLSSQYIATKQPTLTKATWKSNMEIGKFEEKQKRDWLYPSFKPRNTWKPLKRLCQWTFHLLLFISWWHFEWCCVSDYAVLNSRTTLKTDQYYAWEMHCLWFIYVSHKIP